MGFFTLLLNCGSVGLHMHAVNVSKAYKLTMEWSCCMPGLGLAR